MIFRSLGVLALAALPLTACTDDDPSETGTDTGETDAGADSGMGDAGTGDGGMGDAGDGGGGSPLDDDFGAECTKPADDYTPGEDDSWDACISDDGTYTQVEAQVSSIARIAAYEDIADLLVRGDTPTPDDFISARELYAVDEGLDSRVQRREDEHYPPVTDGEGNTLRCRDEGVPAMDPDRCVGPALILPLLTDAFQAGIAGQDPEINAARIDAALNWFMYVSAHKEAVTCTTTKKDCDSAWAYFTGGNQRGTAAGLAANMREASPVAYDRAFDGVLAVRCWRDLDGAEEATDLALRDRAIAQYDEALLFGLSEMVVDRLAIMSGNDGVAREADWAWIQIMGNVLLRDMGERDTQAAADFGAVLAETDASAVDAQGAIDTLRGTYECPSAE